MKRIFIPILLTLFTFTMLTSNMSIDKEKSKQIAPSQMADMYGGKNIIYCIGGGAVAIVGIAAAWTFSFGLAAIVSVYAIGAALDIACGAG